MNIAEWSIKNRTFVMAAVVATMGAGIWAYTTIGRLEDPEFTIKEALIVTLYPGATPEEVAEEVSDEIESAVQQMGQLDRVESTSEPGRSTVQVYIRDQYTSEHLPQVWDELRRRVNDAQRHLPPGTLPSVVFDDFGDVYGVFYAVYGDGYSYAELRDHADLLRRELLLVQDVGKVQLFGDQAETVYVEFSRERIAELGLSPDVLHASLLGQNLASDAGRAVAGPLHIRLDPTGTFQSVEDIENLLILQNDPSGARLYLRDLATVTRGYVDPPSPMMHFNGRPAIGIAVSTVAGGNVVRMGDAIERRMRELEAQTPIGIELGLIAHQAITVTEAVDGFVISLVQAIVIVVGVLMLTMGLRSGLLIGVVLLLTVVATIVVMKLTGVLIERVSLGALIIALGMLVDNTIVVVEGMQVNIRKGMDRVKAAAAVIAQTNMPLLGATVVAILAFAAIGMSQDRTGEYTQSLFLVIMYSLLLSWVLAVTVTPLLGYWFIQAPATAETDPYAGSVYRGYRGMLAGCLRHRGLTAMVLLALLAVGVFAFGQVDRSFFPPSTRAQFMVHYWRPQGTHIRHTEADAFSLYRHLHTLDNVTDVSAFVGSGPPRFLLTMSPEERNPAYAMMLVSVDDPDRIDPLMREIEPYVRAAHPDARVMARRFSLGPSQLQTMEIRLRGPDPQVLQRLAAEVRVHLDADFDVVDVMDDWRERTTVIRPVVSDRRARDAGLTRRDIAHAIRYHTDGLQVGVYREGDLLLPIIARPPEDERQTVASIRDGMIWSKAAQRRVPMSQIISGFETVSEYNMLRRRDRLPTITIGADARSGDAAGAVSRLRPLLAKINLPTGYTLEWGGDDENARRAQLALAGNFPAVGLLMVLTVIALFNALRQPLIIFLTVPLAIIGVALGLLVAGQPFGFMALLGFLSLSGMLIKNAIVLIDELDLRCRTGEDRHAAVLDAGVSRLRPVVLAALTTVLGMIPLLTDQFFVAMAVTIMAGLTFATVLTMIVVPVLYAGFFRIHPPPDVPAPGS